jgi:hypothetical protein
MAGGARGRWDIFLHPSALRLGIVDIGKDAGAPVTEDYETPQGRFTGVIDWVHIDIGKDAFQDPAGMEEALAGRA